MLGLLKPPGKITITLDKSVYSVGEMIKGKVRLEVPEPKNCKELRLEFIAYRKARSSSTIRVGTRRTSSQSTETVYSYKLNLDGERMYSGVRDYDFELAIPQAQQQVKMPDGTMGQIAGLVLGFLAAPLQWQVTATLNVPGGRDANCILPIQIR